VSAPPGDRGRIHELDALRGIAALGVVFWHYGERFHAHPLAVVLHPFYNAGFLLVDFFFVLSGFVVARAYWRDTRQQHPGRNIWARIARLYPLHLFTLLGTLALLTALPTGADDPAFKQPTNDAWHFLLNLTLLNQVGLQRGWSFNVPAWSISTEFVVNVLFLGFIALTIGKRLAVVAAAGVAFALLALAHPGFSDALAFGFLDLNLLRCLVGFGAGVVVYLLLHRLKLATAIGARPRLASALGLCSLAAMVALMLASQRHPPPWHYLVSIAIAIGCVAFIPLGPLTRTLLCRRPLVFLGDISYSIYLTHYPLQLALYLLASVGILHLDFSQVPVLIGFCVLVIGVSTLTQKYVELPAQRALLARTPRRLRPA